MLRRASVSFIGGLHTAGILRRRLQSSLTESPAKHLTNYKETTIMVVKLYNGDFLVGSDSRRTVPVGPDSSKKICIVSDIVNKVDWLKRTVLVARAGNVFYLKCCVNEMSRANFSRVDRSLWNVLEKGIEYVNRLSCDRTLSLIVMGYVEGISQMFWLAYRKKKGSHALRRLVELSSFHVIGSGARYVKEYVLPALRELAIFEVESTLELAEIGLLFASLYDPSTGGYITVRLFTPKGVEELSQNLVLDLAKKHYDVLARFCERSVLIVYKMLIVEPVVEGVKRGPWLVPDVDMCLLETVIVGEEGLRELYYFGHPLSSLCDGFYVQLVRFFEVESVDCIMRNAQEVDEELLFAYSSCGVKKLDVGGKSVFVMAATRSNLANLKGCLPPVDYSL